MSDTLRDMIEKAVRPRMIIAETLESWTPPSKSKREFAAMEIIDALRSDGYEIKKSDDAEEA